MIGTILLDYNDRYLVNDNLPLRPESDKDLLRVLCSCGKVSQQGKNILPMSILRGCDRDDRIAVRIRELAMADMLLVNRSMDFSPPKLRDKKFRLHNHEFIGKVEVWLRKQDL